MKNLLRDFNLPLFVLLVVLTAGCEYTETEFGFSGSIKGTVKDNQGNLVYSDVLTNNVVIKLLGEGDKQASEVRVKGDGKFENIKIFPKKHKIWISGPVVFQDTVTNDFSKVVTLEKDFIVTPFISAKIANATVNGTTITVAYTIAPAAGKTVSKSEVYCSTAQYPTSTIGSYGVFYSTKTVSLPTLSGSASITGLTSGKRYFIRIGSLAGGTTLMNYSNQVEVTIP